VPPENQTLAEMLVSPPVLITFLVCALLAGLVLWVVSLRHKRQLDRALGKQRRYQDATVERLLDSTTKDREQIIAEDEKQLRQRDERIAALEGTVKRLRDRLSSSGILGLFGGKQRDVVSALLLENEQLHELLLEKQEQLRDQIAGMTQQLVDQLDEQTRASAQAVRYKQALLSAFLQQEEARTVLDRMISDGRIASLSEADVAPPDEPA